MTSAPTATERAMLATLSYFDMFNSPLTARELWRWLYTDGDAPSLADVLRTLRESAYLRSRIEHVRGFYVLTGRGSIVPTRNERYLFAERKFRRVQRVVRVLRFLPFIRAIAVCNSLAYANSRNDGDLDLLIVTAPGRIWTTRLFTTGLAALLRWRPTADRTRDAVCLSFFLSADHLDLHTLTMGEEDRYFRYWMETLVPVYGDAHLLEQLQEQNAWYRQHLPNAFGTSVSPRRWVAANSASRIVRGLLEALHAGAFGDALEHSYRRLQQRLLPPKLRSMANQDTRVVLNDHMLKFHEGDRRAAFTEQFTHRLQEVA